MTKNHKVEYDGKLYEARQFVGRFAGVSKVDYTGEPLYNVLLEEHSTMTVNNLTCETLHPDNHVARLYTGRYDIPAVSTTIPSFSMSRLLYGY